MGKQVGDYYVAAKGTFCAILKDKMIVTVCLTTYTFLVLTFYLLGWRRVAKFSLKLVNQISEKLSQVKETLELFVKKTRTIGFSTMLPLTKKLHAKDVNGFKVLPSQVECVRCVFERHPDIAVEFRGKNQLLRKACMNFLLSIIETLCQSLKELSNEDLVEADIALTYLKDAGFKVDWLEKKLDQVKENKEKEQSSLVRLQEMEDSLLKLWLKCSELDALVEKEEAELLATRSPLVFDDVV